jgi:hypothetical protein
VDEPEHLERYAPLADEPRSPQLKAKKRRKLNETRDPPSGTKRQSGKANEPIQRKVSEGLRVTKPRHASVTIMKKSAATVPASDTDQETSARHSFERPTQPISSVPHSADHNISEEKRAVAEAVDLGRHTSTASVGEQSAGPPTLDPDTKDCDTNDYEGHMSQVPGSDVVSGGEEFDDDLNDEEFFKLTSDIIDTGCTGEGFSSPPLKSNVVHTVTTINSQCPNPSALSSAVTAEAESKTDNKFKKFVSPITLTNRLLAATGDINPAAARKPIVRQAFPDAVRDRSPIIGLSSNMLLRTCFRIGEAINQAHQSSKSGKHVVFELYARILDSERDETMQHFTFCDLFHGKPPYIKATYAAAIWKPVQLFNYDCTRLQQQGRVCRTMGTMKRDGKDWVLSVLNIWEATWDDIKWVEGIVNS